MCYARSYCRQVFYFYVGSAWQAFAARQSIVCTTYADWNDRDVQFHSQYGKSLLECPEFAGVCATSLWEYHEVFALFKHFCHFEDRILKVAALHEYDVVAACKTSAQSPLHVFLGSIEVIV